MLGICRFVVRKGLDWALWEGCHAGIVLGVPHNCEDPTFLEIPNSPRLCLSTLAPKVGISYVLGALGPKGFCSSLQGDMKVSNNQGKG